MRHCDGELPSPRVKRLRYFVSFISLFTIVVGLLGPVGSAFGIIILKSLVSGGVVIKPNAAVGFVLIGTSLWLLRERREQRLLRIQEISGQSLAAMTAVLGLLSFGEYLFGWQLGIDQLLFRERAADAFGSIRPGLMSPITALDFVLLGLALLLLDHPVSRRHGLAQSLSLLAGSAAIFGLLDFILTPRTFHTHIALQSAATLLLLSWGVICARTDRGLGALLASSSLGAALAWRLLPAAVLIPLTLGAVRSLDSSDNLWTGIAAIVVFNIVLMAGFTVWTAREIDRVDHERQSSASALELSERRYRLLFEGLLDGFAYCKMSFDDHGCPTDFVYVEVNSAFENITGLVNVVGKRATEAIPGIQELHPELFEIYGRVATTGRPEKFEIEFKPFGKWLSISVYSPEREYFIAVFDDISNRKQSEGVSQRLAAIVESSQDAIIGESLDGIVTSWNSAAERLYLYRADEAIGKSITLIVPPEKERELQDVLDRAKRGESSQNLETQRRRKDGTLVQVSLTASAIRNGEGKVVGVSAIVRDITERKKVEEQLGIQTAALMAAANAIVITDRKGQILWVNPAFTTLTGYEASEAIGQNPSVLKSGQHERAFYAQMWNTLLGGRVWHGEVVNCRKDGACYTEEMTITPVFSADGVVHHFVAIKQDITARKSLEAQLRQSQKMEAVGQLAGGVAHDFNNLLQVITLYVDLLPDKLGSDNPIHAELTAIRKASEHAAQLVSQLLAFSRKQVLQPRSLNLNSIVSEANTMLRRLIHEDIELSTVLATDLGLVKADPSQIIQVLFNLATNARDAMPYGGTITIETQNVTLNQGEVHSPLSVPAGSYAALRVTDSGIGMDEATKARIFEPFFTTKGASGAGKGTGLGLASVYGIVKQSDGYIWVDSQIGRGSSFNIYLPLVEEEPAPEQAKPESALLRGQVATVLVVEDSAAIRVAMPAILKTIECQVLLAADGIEALGVAERHPGPIHLLITDVMMPGLRGPELACQLRATRPEMKVLYISGYSSEIVAGRPGSSTDGEFIQKPFKQKDLLTKINELLASVKSATAVNIDRLQPAAGTNEHPSNQLAAPPKGLSTLN